MAGGADAIDVLPLEEVEVVNTKTGSRFNAWVQATAHRAKIVTVDSENRVVSIAEQ